jgi:uncharacterized protein
MQNKKSWKPSYFNVPLDNNGKRLMLNGANGLMLQLGKPQSEILDMYFDEIERNGNCSNETLLQCLVKLGFVVPQSEDEYLNARGDFAATRASRDSFRVTIAPTMACNMHCSYCFQRDMTRNQSMSPKIQEGAVEFIRRMAAGSRLLIVQWFGGEPLLAYDQILAMSEALRRSCEEQGIDYYSEMLTNGTLLTTQIIKSFKKIALKAIQIPLDGALDTYAKRKGVTADRARAFHRFLAENLQALVDVTGSVTIRINVDRENPEAGREVVRMIKEQGCFDPRIDFRLGFLNTSRGVVDCIPHDCLQPSEFSRLEVDFLHFLAQEGYRVYGAPTKRNFPCAAPLAHACTIDPQGGIGKCVPAISTQQSVFTRIYPDDIERTMQEFASGFTPYISFDPFESDQCKGCKLLPLCLGSCPKLHEDNKPFSCGMKEGLLERLRFYQQYYA